ncbi:MAG: AI-2E family transporter [Proteobacteria bacterium]|nr:AI-2E family transporter [Pseudomonadota bacterium]
MAEAQASVEGSGSRPRRALFLGVSGVLLVACIVVFRAVLVPFVLGLVLAYVLYPLVTATERLRAFGRQPPRWLAVLVLYAALLGALSATVVFAVPRLALEVNKAAGELPRLAVAAKDEWLPWVEDRMHSALSLAGNDAESSGARPALLRPRSSVGTEQGPRDSQGIRIVGRSDGGYEIRLPEQGLLVASEGEAYRVTVGKPRQDGPLDLATTVADAVRRAAENTERTTVAVLAAVQAVVRALSNGVFTFFITLMLSAYLIITSDRIRGFFRALYLPSQREEFDRLVHRIDRGLAGVIRGQLLICLVNGILSGIGFYFFGLKYWVGLTLLATVLSLVPIFGAILSSIPAVAIALQDGIVLALLVLGWIVIIHQIEANLLNPKIMGDAAKVHPVLVVFALLAGAHVAGIIGALLGVPVLSITQSLFLHFREQALGVPKR